MAHDEPEDEMAAKEVATNSQPKRPDCDTSMKPEGYGLLESSALCVSSSNDWPKSSTQSFTDNLHSNNFSRRELPLVGNEPPCSSIYSMNNRERRMVGEMTVRNSENRNSELASSSNNRNVMSITHGQWRHLYQLGGLHKSSNHLEDMKSKDEDLMPFKHRDSFQRMPLDIKNLSPLIGKKSNNKDSVEVSAYATHIYNKTTTGNLPTPEVNRSTSLASSSFSKFFLKQSSRNKEVPSKPSGLETDNNIAGVVQNNGKQAITSMAGHDMALNCSGAANQPSDCHVDEGVPKSSCDGISLREWLKPGAGCYKILKTERLQLFKQIVQFVDFAHSQGFVLQDLRPSQLTLLPSNAVKYSGSLRKKESLDVLNHNINKKRLPELSIHGQSKFDAKLQKLGERTDLLRHPPQFSSSCGSSSVTVNTVDSNANTNSVQNFNHSKLEGQNIFGYQITSIGTLQKPSSTTIELEKRWYACPDEPDEKSLLPSNIYSLGVLLFELLSSFESIELLSAAMTDLRYRILPSKFLSENPNEAGFCLWLLHPEPGSRPTTSDILQSKLICDFQETHLSESVSSSVEKDDDNESELLLYFLISLKEHKQKQAVKLNENIENLETDIKEVEKRHLDKYSSDWARIGSSVGKRGSHVHCGTGNSNSLSASTLLEARLMKDISLYEKAYFYMRSQIQLKETNASVRTDKGLLRNRDRWSTLRTERQESNMEKRPADHFGALFEGVCKFARYSKFQVCGTLKNSDLLNSANVICALSFDREEDHFAAAGVSKKIKIFECNSLLDDSIDIHYPVVEMSNNSKLSSVCWNKYMKNYLASTDYDGVVQMWDASSGQGFSKYIEHQKRAWSVDFSHVDPTKFASGSDDFSVKVWSMNERSSISTIGNPANVCCVQFSSYSSYLLAFGCADYKIYCYDLRNTRIPWCSLSGHGKAVSYIKFLDAETLVSASTDNTLKLWDLNQTNFDGKSSGSCSLTFSGHTNKKNFVGLSVYDGYIACGSETNEVIAYYRSLPMPVTSHKFGTVDPVPEHETAENNGQFVSSVCWRAKSNMVLAANSCGTIKLLRLV